MAQQDRWNIWGRQWLDTLEDMAANVDPGDPTTRLTQFEKNLQEQLRTMVMFEDTATVTEDDKREESFRHAAAEYFRSNLDENDWDIDDSPRVSCVGEGAYVAFWRWFSNDDIVDEEG